MSQTVYEHTFGGSKVVCLVTGDKWQQNTYLVINSGASAVVVVDPGGEADCLIRRIEESGFSLRRILLTHPHHDHVGAASQLAGHFNVECELHKLDFRLLMHAPMYATRFAGKTLAPVSRHQVFEEVQPDDRIELLKSIHTPGHTVGSTCYLFNGFIFTGDTLLHECVGRTDLPGGNKDALRASIETLLNGVDGDTVVLPGHGKPWTIREARAWWSTVQALPPEHRTFRNNSE